MNNIFQAILWGLVGFVVTIIVLAILSAIFEAIALPQIAAILDRFQWLIALLVGIVVGLNRYNGRTIA